MKRITTSFIASAICLTASAQIHLTADLQNNHLWRGMEVDAGVGGGCISPTPQSRDRDLSEPSGCYGIRSHRPYCHRREEY